MFYNNNGRVMRQNHNLYCRVQTIHYNTMYTLESGTPTLYDTFDIIEPDQQI